MISNLHTKIEQSKLKSEEIKKLLLKNQKLSLEICIQEIKKTFEATEAQISTTLIENIFLLLKKEKKADYIALYTEIIKLTGAYHSMSIAIAALKGVIQNGLLNEYIEHLINIWPSCTKEEQLGISMSFYQFPYMCQHLGLLERMYNILKLNMQYVVHWQLQEIFLMIRIL